MTSTRLQLVAVSLVLVGLLVLGGISDTVFDDDDPDGDALVAEVIENHGEIETLRATMVFQHETHTVDESSPSGSSMTADVWKRPPDQSRIEVVDAEIPEVSPGDVTVIDGSTRQHYFTESEQLLIDNDSDWGAVQYAPDVFLDEYGVEYVETDSVDGRTAHVVEIEPIDGASTGGISLLIGPQEFELEIGDEEDGDPNRTVTTTWWIDAEATYPIKEEVVFEHQTPEENAFDREKTVRTVRYEDVAFDEEFPDGTFDYEPPDGTEVYEPRESFDVETLAEAADAVPFSVSDPAIPERFDLQHVDANEFKGDATVQLLYRDGDELDDDSVIVRITERPPAFEEDDVLDDGVGEVDGKLVETVMGTTLVWDCTGVRYEVTPKLEADDPAVVAEEIADDTGCA